MRAVHLREPDAFIRFQDVPGREPPVVYLHGVGYAAAASFGHIAQRRPLGRRRSILVDFLGFGFSDRPPDFAYDVADHAAGVIRVLETLRLPRCDLVGHSMGGSIAIIVAASRPDLVSRLAVLEANLDPGPGPLTSSILRQPEAGYIEHGHSELLAQLQRDASAPAGTVASQLLTMFELAAPWAVYRSSRSLTAERTPTFRDVFTHLEMPRTFLVGSETRNAATRPRTGEDGSGLAECGVDVVVVPKAGHPMMFQNADGVARALAAALPAPP